MRSILVLRMVRQAVQYATQLPRQQGDDEQEETDGTAKHGAMVTQARACRGRGAVHEKSRPQAAFPFG
jgi:hypothetical protein